MTATRVLRSEVFMMRRQPAIISGRVNVSVLVATIRRARRRLPVKVAI